MFDFSDPECPDPDDRYLVFQDWSCTDYLTFQTNLAIFDLNTLLVKSLQVLAFSFIAFVLISQSCNGNRVIGKLQIAITFLTIFQGIASILRTVALLPVSDNKDIMWNFLGITILFDNIAFFNAVWLFSAMICETAIDIEIMLLPNSERSSE